jgi:O-antigen ligase
MVHAAAAIGRVRLGIVPSVRTAGALVALLLLCPLAHVGAGPLLFGTAVAASAALRPQSTLLWLTAALPIAPIVLPALTGWPASVAEAAAVAFVAGAAVRHAVDGRQAIPHAYMDAVLALVAVVAASLTVQAALAGVLVTPAALPAHLANAWLTLYEPPDVMPSAIAARQLLTAIAVSAFVASWTADATFRAQLLRVSIIGGVGAALFSAARIAQIALRTEAPLAAMPHVLGTVRVSGPFSDLNAAGSYFLLLCTPAVAGALTTDGRRRTWWCVAAALLAFGVWTSGSRAAVLVGLVCIGAWVVVAAWRTSRWRYPIIGAVLVVSAAVVWLFPNPIVDRSVTSAVGIRAEMARVAERMWRTDPWIGVGIGRFYERSGEFVRDPYVKNLYGRENAHNNFLQVLAELGVIGLTAFGLLLWRASPAVGDVDALSLGILAFLATCLAGHPLLLFSVALPFWILVGAAAGRNAVYHHRRRWVTPALIALAVLAIVPSFRVERGALNLEHAGSGVSGWRVDADGTRFREMTGKSRIFAPRAGGQIAIALRTPAPTPEPVILSISVEGQTADRVVLSRNWTTERLRMPDDPRYAFLTLDLEALDAHGASAVVDVGKVEPLGGR